MATIQPFAALLPQPALAAKICELPYDVMSSEEARALASGNPLSFLRVSKPEIDLPPGTDLYSPEVYAKGRENFLRLQSEGALVRDSQSCYYLYRQVMGRHAQVGLVAASSCQEYLDGIIKKHELTRVDKEDDRVRHIDTLDSQTGPVFLTYRAVADIDAFVARQIATTPYVDFVGNDGVRHTSWRVSAASDMAFLRGAFAKIPNLYIADGHHRSAAAGRVYQARRGAGSSGGFLTVIFPHNQMQILPYNRVMKDLNGLTSEALLKRLEAVFEILPGAADAARGKHLLGLYLDGTWQALAFRPGLTVGQDAIGTLDVSLLQNQVLAPVFGIDDPRTSKRVQFVGGIRGTTELERLVESGEYACAFSMFPTGIEDLMAIADQGGIMPPKSTWFEPKLRDAMFCLMLS
jgi:uncharacterized protein (DUF1015 family)